MPTIDILGKALPGRSRILLDRKFAAQQFAHRSQPMIRYSAWNDVRKVGHVRVHIEGKAMGRNPFADLDSDSGNLLIINPNPGMGRESAARKAELSNRLNEGSFDVSKKEVQILPMIPKIKDGI